MIFGSISYLNLLPFQVYLKRVLSNSQLKQIINSKKSTPSTINRAYKAKKIDAAFISSIKSRASKCTNLGIVSNGKVYSVLILPKDDAFDSESDTSNALSKVLNLNGEVIIGDKALRYYLSNPNANFKDLSYEWKKKRGLPFVFARLCYNKHSKKIKKLAKNFKGKQEKIPQYILKKEAKSRGITPKELKWYLNFIDYKLGYKELKALKLFLKKAKQ